MITTGRPEWDLVVALVVGMDSLEDAPELVTCEKRARARERRMLYYAMDGVMLGL